MVNIIDTLKESCQMQELHCFAIVGNKENYDVLTLGDYDQIGETLYFALCQDEKLLSVVAESVRIASEVVSL